MLPSELKEKKILELNNPKVYKKISNNFIENSIVNSNISTLKILYYLATILENYDYLKEYNEYTINLNDMLEYTKLTSQNIRDNIKKMQQTSITFVNEVKNIESGISLLPKYHFHWNKNKITLTLDKKICALIIDVTKRYTFINTKELMKLKSIHSFRLLPILHMINGYDIKQKTYTLNNLNELFETKYKSLSQFETNILRKTKNELDNNSSLSFNYQINFDNLGLGRPKAISLTLFSKSLYSNKDIKNKIIKENEEIKNLQIKKIKDWQPNKDLINSLPVEYGIAQTSNESLIYEFELYLEEQVIAFKKYCIENKKNYKDMDVSFKRHIEGAFNNKIDFFSKNGFN